VKSLVLQHLFMRKLILLILFLGFCKSSYSQILKGRILDQKTDSTIGYASVYFNGSLIGTLTDRDGYFELDISKYLSMPITVSALGYFSKTLTDFQTKEVQTVYLTPKVFALKEVVVKAKAFNYARTRDIKVFKTQFLGQSMNALKCEILNIEDIMFLRESGSDTLKAYSSKPILIENNSIGYKITYFLDKFEYCKTKGSLILTGNYLFKEDSAESETQKKVYENRRRTAYLGSRMHFFRTLWGGDLSANGFDILNTGGTPAMYLVIQKDSVTKCLKYKGDLIVNYFQKLNGSVISMLKDEVCFDVHGYFDPLGISWSGEMSRHRIADLLPYGYKEKKPSH
jgi:hypothetical protein